MQFPKNDNCFTWFVEYPINNYNVTFYVGKYAAFSDTLISRQRYPENGL